MAFKLKSGSSDRAARQPKSMAFKVAVMIEVNGGTSAKEAIANQCETFEYTLTKSMKDHAPSALFQFRKSVMNAVEKGDQEVIDALTAANMLEETPDVVEETADSIDE